MLATRQTLKATITSFPLSEITAPKMWVISEEDRELVSNAKIAKQTGKKRKRDEKKK